MDQTDMICSSCRFQNECRACGQSLDQVYGVMCTMDHTASPKIISAVHGLEPLEGHLLINHLMGFHDLCLAHRSSARFADLFPNV